MNNWYCERLHVKISCNVCQVSLTPIREAKILDETKRRFVCWGDRDWIGERKNENPSNQVKEEGVSGWNWNGGSGRERKKERKGNHGDKARKIRHTYTEYLELLTSLVYFWFHVLFLPVPGREKTIIKEKEHRETYRSRYGVANNQQEKKRERARQSWPSILTSTHKLWFRFLLLVTLACSHFRFLAISRFFTPSIREESFDTLFD